MTDRWSLGFYLTLTKSNSRAKDCQLISWSPCNAAKCIGVENSHLGLLFKAQQIACSRPPPPITKTFKDLVASACTDITMHRTFLLPTISAAPPHPSPLLKLTPPLISPQREELKAALARAAHASNVERLPWNLLFDATNGARWSVGRVP
jgi:hypothetical protein